MFSFGWVTQSKITRNIKVNNILTRVIKEYLSEIGFEHYKFENYSNKNCYKREQDGLCVAVYTRHIDCENDLSTWAVYKYIKEMAEKDNKVVLLLGTVVGDALAGKLYKLDKESIISLFEGKELTRGKYVSINDSMDIVTKKKFDDFKDGNELRALVEALGVE